MELGFYVRTDCVLRGSHCFESEQSGTNLFHAHVLRSAWLTLISVVTKWNYLVPCARTEYEQSGPIMFNAHGLRLARFVLFKVITKWNYLVQCARTAFSAVRIFQSRSKWNYLVQCAQTALSAVRIVLSPNNVKLSTSVHMDCVQRGLHCSV